MRHSQALWLGCAVTIGAACLPSVALGDARISRQGNVVTLTSDGDGDHITAAAIDRTRYIGYSVSRGQVLRAGRGCRRFPRPAASLAVVTCGRPTQNRFNVVRMEVKLGGGDDYFGAESLYDAQPLVRVDGGPGNDKIFGSMNSDDISGGPGDDLVAGGDDVDNLRGGDGSDELVGGPGDDSLSGDAGFDKYWGDSRTRTTLWGNDVIDATDLGPDQITCGEGPSDAAVVDRADTVDRTCENLAGGQMTPPRDTVGTLPLRVTFGALSESGRRLEEILRGEPIRIPVTFSAGASIKAELRLSAAEAHRLHVPSSRRTIATDIGTPLTIIPLTFNTQMRLTLPARRSLASASRVKATLTITADDKFLRSTTVSKVLMLRR